ncbi:hypothetical protein [Kitasatospora sp. NPDC096204]|uniref:hypothetical protein n=1 Tax=Kitasatospora sp. NPDC096204 TaxID=3364094 RepID=UPI003821A69F
MPSAGGFYWARSGGGRRGGAWCRLPDLDSIGEQLPDGGLGLVLVAVAGVEVAVLPDLVHIGGKVGGVEGDVEPAVVPGPGDGPTAGTHRGPREVDVRPGAGPLRALALGLFIFAALTLGRQLGLALLLGLLAQQQERGPGLGGLVLQLQGKLAGGLAAAGGFLAAGQRGQGLGFVTGGPRLGQLGAVVLPDTEHGPAVGGGHHVAALVLLEEAGGDDQLDHAAAHSAALGPEAGPGRDEPVAGAVPPHPAVGVLAGGRRDEAVHPLVHPDFSRVSRVRSAVMYRRISASWSSAWSRAAWWASSR